MAEQVDRFEAVEAVDLEWQRLPDWWKGRPAEGEPDLRYMMFNEGGNGIPPVSLNEYEPHHLQKRHRHLEDEILLLFDGDLEIEGRHYTAPSMIFVGKGTAYGPLRAGPNGTRFFRVALTHKAEGAARHGGL